MDSPNTNATLLPEDMYRYELSTVVTHEGRLDNGHYWADVRAGCEWFHCDDDKSEFTTSVRDQLMHADRPLPAVNQLLQPHSHKFSHKRLTFYFTTSDPLLTRSRHEQNELMMMMNSPPGHHSMLYTAPPQCPRFPVSKRKKLKCPRCLPFPKIATFEQTPHSLSRA